LRQSIIRLFEYFICLDGFIWHARCIYWRFLNFIEERRQFMEEYEKTDAWIFGLLVACPAGAELPKCPLAKVRPKPLKERLEVVQNMTNSQKESLVIYHAECVKIRGKA
jgi:hypothetical protein